MLGLATTCALATGELMIDIPYSATVLRARAANPGMGRAICVFTQSALATHTTGPPVEPSALLGTSATDPARWTPHFAPTFSVFGEVPFMIRARSARISSHSEPVLLFFN